MPFFSGQFQYLDPKGGAIQSAPCRVSFEAENFTLTPTSGPPITFDLGDIDIFSPGDYELTLTLYTGKKIVLSKFAKTLDNLRHELLEAYRQRLLQCLLLEDLEEVARFDGFAELEPAGGGKGWTSPAEFRLFKSNLAVLPIGATGFQWRLADIQSVGFDASQYATVIESAGGRLAVTKLAKRTEEFKEKLEKAVSDLNETSAETLHRVFSFLLPDQFRAVAGLMREGHAVPLGKLKAIHPGIDRALVTNVIDSKLKPYFDGLVARTQPDAIYTGFKLLREDEAAVGATLVVVPGVNSEESVQTTAGDEVEAAKPPILHWFFFPITPKSGTAPSVVAWEATSASGRATYFFRLPTSEAVEQTVRELNHAIVMLNFRREPIYLPDERLELEPRFRRHAIACRKIPELRRLRASFIGRAIHTSPEAWTAQVNNLLQE